MKYRILSDSFVGSERDEDKGGIVDCLACFTPIPKEYLFEEILYCPRGCCHRWPASQ